MFELFESNRPPHLPFDQFWKSKSGNQTNHAMKFYLCLSVSICVQVVKTRINKGFLARVDGHCQRNCQFCGGCKHYSPQFVSIPLKLAHYTLTCRDGSVA